MRLQVGLVKEPWKRSKQWAQDMVTIHYLKSRSDREEQWKFLATLMGAKIG